jgi:glyoxylase-like metal-dependent hydrolase (beta-lactamase superfamily II)
VDDWIELADGVLVHRHSPLDLTTGLVIGTERALVIDTGGDERQGARWAAAVRSRTSLPWEIVLTHGHFDHCFGTRAFLPTAVWAHPGCTAFLRRTATAQRDRWSAHYRAAGQTDLAEALENTEPIPPDHPAAEREIDLGDRVVRLFSPGAGHTDHDLAVEIPDAGVLFAGDLVEQGAPPDFEDAEPDSWPSAVQALLQRGPAVVVPGHGTPVGPEFVAKQRDELGLLAELCRRFHAGSSSGNDVLRRSPYPSETTRAALHRYAANPA